MASGEVSVTIYDHTTKNQSGFFTVCRNPLTSHDYEKRVKKQKKHLNSLQSIHHIQVSTYTFNTIVRMPRQ